MSAEEVQSLAEQALTLLNQRRLGEALRLYEQICNTDAGNADAWLKRGVINSMLNQPDKAIDCCTRAVTLLPDSVDARTSLANVLLQSGRWTDAAEQCEKMVHMDPGSATAWFMLGRSRAEQDRLQEAADAYRKALQIKPDLALASHGLGFALHRQGQWTQAIGHFRHALQLNPKMAQAHWGLGMSLQKLGNLQEALHHYQQAIKLNPKHAEARLGIGMTLSLMGKQDLAVASLSEAIKLKPGYVDAYISLAATLLPLGRQDEAQQLVEKVLQLQPDNAEAISLATTIDQHKGDIDKAHKRLKPLIEAGLNEVNVALAYATICNSIGETDNGIRLLEQQLEKGQTLTASGRRNVHFNLGKLYDSSKDYARAFEHYQKGNALKETEFDPRLRDAEVDTAIATYTPDLMASLPRSRIQSDRPVFVVGMPRSGTSLIEQILASHPAVFGAGELNYVIQMAASLQSTLGKAQAYPQCLPALTQQEIDRLAQHYLDQIAELSPDAARVVDKMPGNFMHLGFIELLFPGARIIHSMRDPLDTCLSCYFQDFSRSHPYSYDFAQLGAFYKSYERIMQHWRKVLRIPMIEMQYEDLISDQEGASRRIVDFCGLEWNDQCYNFHETQRYVATASYDQVRRPIYSSSVSRWKNYAEFLDPLREALKSDNNRD